MRRRQRRARQASAQGGFTLVEVLVVVAIIGLLTAIAAPMYINFVRRAEAGTIVTDYHTFVICVMQYHTDMSTFPPDRLPGEQVPELKTYVGDKLKMNHARWVYDWENWINADGSPNHASTGIAYGFTVQTADLRLVEALYTEYSGPLYQTQPGRYTFMIEPITE